MLKFEVHCKDCVFAGVKDGVQNECLLGKTDSIENKVLEEGFYKFGRHCNSFRDEQWLKNVDGCPKEKVALETKARLGVCINFIGSYDNELLRETVKSINNAQYYIIINDRPEHNKDLYDIVKQETNVHPSRINIVQIINQKPEYYIDEGFNAGGRNGYFCYVNSGTFFPPNFIDQLNNVINNQMKPVMVCYDGNFILFQSMLFKYLNGNKARMLSDGSVDNRNFLEKAGDLNSENNCIFAWGEIFNA
jgi:hypothetical protein